MILSVSEQIKIIMKRQKMSVEKVALSLGCTRQNLNTKLKKNDMRVSDLQKIAEILDCDLLIELREK